MERCIAAPRATGDAPSQHHEPPKACSMARPSATPPAKLHCSPAGVRSILIAASMTAAALQCSLGQCSNAVPTGATESSNAASHVCGVAAPVVSAPASSLRAALQHRRRVAQPPPACCVAAPVASDARLRFSCFIATPVRNGTLVAGVALPARNDGVVQHRQQLGSARGTTGRRGCCRSPTPGVRQVAAEGCTDEG